jgi:AcrR family transcriptional regulator
MTKADIIQAAFKVWGRSLYLDTSLTQVARELRVSKPALYRHFKNKQALLDAMYASFFDDYAAFIKADYERAIAAADKTEGMLIMMRAILEYYARNVYAFIFSLIQVYGNREVGNMADQLRSRGVDMREFRRFQGNFGAYPLVFQLTIATMTFLMAYSHKQRYDHGQDMDAILSEAAIGKMVSPIDKKITAGLGFDRVVVDAIDYEGLEKRVSASVHIIEDDGLLRAVAGAVAEAGPWNASMDMVAKRSGLSKSGLYAHFKNKQDMLAQLFLTEFNRLADFADASRGYSDVPEEQLYLVIISIADYLRSRPEILITVDWLKTRRLDLGLSAPPRIYRILSGIKLKGSGIAPNLSEADSDQIANWLLFLIVNTLMRGARTEGRVSGTDFAAVDNSTFRVLYRFIVLGIQGFNL